MSSNANGELIICCVKKEKKKHSLNSAEWKKSLKVKKKKNE